eukprot:TRINITY_DN41973_c0_g1_i1.p1 TRINITY_DN41973_c0_g1~~TRINITY_DN41973_c0_g1_i1.p1  ORF type:complete len:252 (+),score=46.33 TRINITY_DN41973_c0_g1_i1:92-847(+)
MSFRIRFCLAFSLQLLSFLGASSKKHILERAISCDICKLAVENAISSGLATEEGIEDLCEPKHKSGRWLGKIDLHNFDGNRSVQVKFHATKFGKCRKECSVSARACRLVMDEKDGVRSNKLASLLKADSTEFSEFTVEEKTKMVIEKICNKEMASSSKKKKTSIPAVCSKSTHSSAPLRSWDEEFVEIEQKVAEMEDMMADMKEKTGMGMKMYHRDDLKNMGTGDMEAMAAREALAQDRQEKRFRENGGEL